MDIDIKTSSQRTGVLRRRIWRERWLCIVSIGAIVGVGPAGPACSANADTGTKNSDDSLQEIVVTAEFRRENLQQTPIAISVTSGPMLDARGESNVIDAANRAPDVTLTPAGSVFGSAATASIRGVGQYDPSFALEPGVGMYVDDVYHGTLFGSILDLMDLDRVEVLRGPQGTLAGKNSIGGAIKLYSKTPTAEEGGYLDLEYGSFNRLNVKASGDFVVVPDRVFVRLSGVSKRADGFFTDYDYACVHPGSGLPTLRLETSCKTGTEGGQDLQGARLAIRWLATDSIENNFIVNYTDDESQVAPNKLIYANNPSITLNGVPYDNRFLTGAQSYSSYANFVGTPADAASFSVPAVNAVRAWSVSDALDVGLSDNISIKSITALQGMTGESGADADASPIDVETVLNTAATHQFTEELRLSGDSLADTIKWTVGGFYFQSHELSGGRLDIRSSGLDFLSDDAIRSESKSGFAHVAWQASEKLSFDTGIRYTSEWKEYTFNRYNPDGSIPSCVVVYPDCGDNYELIGLTGSTGEYRGSHVDYRFGANYQWTPDILTYAQVSTGYKGGGINPRPFFPSQIASFGPETLTSYEIGIKSDWLEKTVRLNLAAFESKYKDIQLTLLECNAYSPFAGAPCALPVNGGDATIKGVELETELHPTGGLTIDASVSVLSFQYTRVAPDTGITKGMITPYTPKRKATFGVQYDVQLGSYGSITPRFDWSYQSLMYTDSAVNTPYSEVGGYSLANAHLLWKDAKDRWESALTLSNAFDKFYYLNKLDLSNQASGGYVTGQPGPPRQWLVSIRRNF
jgi:iron complex outermembrane recepter protein